MQHRFTSCPVADPHAVCYGLLICLRQNGPNLPVAELQGDGPGGLGRAGQTVDLRVPRKSMVRGRRKEIVPPPDAHTAADVDPRQPIVVALARGEPAYRCQKMLDAG